MRKKRKFLIPKCSKILQMPWFVCLSVSYVKYISIMKFGWSLDSIFQETREKKLKIAIFGDFGNKKGVNLACCTKNLQLQHHFSNTRHPSSQNDTNFKLLYLRLGYRQNFLGLAAALFHKTTAPVAFTVSSCIYLPVEVGPLNSARWFEKKV